MDTNTQNSPQAGQPAGCAVADGSAPWERRLKWMASEPRTPEAISKDLIAALHELAVLRSKLADLYEGHAAVLPKNEDHARKMMAVASAFLPNKAVNPTCAE